LDGGFWTDRRAASWPEEGLLIISCPWCM
jgi:hypothetical protein